MFILSLVTLHYTNLLGLCLRSTTITEELPKGISENNNNNSTVLKSASYISLNAFT